MMYAKEILTMIVSVDDSAGCRADILDKGLGFRDVRDHKDGAGPRWDWMRKHYKLWGQQQVDEIIAAAETLQNERN
jgi:hypothetical protein